MSKRTATGRLVSSAVVAFVVAAFVLGDVLAACNASTATGGPVASAVASEEASSAGSASTSVTPAVTVSPSEEPLDTAIPSDETSGPDASDVTQTATEWGRIWDELPASFPRFPGSEPSTEIGAPASAQLVVPTDVATATAWLKAALDAKGLRTTVSGPLEDGSMTLDSTGPNGCAAQTTIGRQGSVTVMTILYGAACPFA